MGSRIWFIIVAICIAAVEIAVGVLISHTIAMWMLVVAIPLGTVALCKASKPNIQISLKKGGNRMLIGLGIAGIVVCIGGIIGCSFLIISQSNIKDGVKATIVYCCTRDNIYQIWADNKGNDKDILFVTLGTSSLITDFRTTMGASLPSIIEGGKNANFITFKIEQLPPSVSLTYLVYVSGSVEQPHKFTAWSEVTKNNISVKFVGECPKITEWRHEEKVPR